MIQTLRRIAGILIVAAALVVTALVYLPGLSGAFVFDDFSFVVFNPAIRITESSSVSDWVAAAVSFPSGVYQGRWLGMLSFAFNHYLSGMTPYGFKLTNLAIHLLNGLLLFLVFRALFDLHQLTRPEPRPARTFNVDLAAAALAGLWLVLPINLTCVLYVSQRLESLSTTFVFIGLWGYLRARVSNWRGLTGHHLLWAALILGTGFGLMVKESAVLLPLYAASAEFALTGGRDRNGRWNRPILLLYACLLALPLVIGLIWLAGWVDMARSYGRAFDVGQRLLTESRVLVDYMVWTITPSLDQLSLYHDDISLSRGLLDPPTTLGAVMLIASLVAVAFWQRRRRPLLALGIFWYFGGHALTATIIPLMLAFEHRNYFPSVGLLLAAGAVLGLEGPRLRSRTIALCAASIFVFYAFITALRAKEWSDPVRLTLSEASKRIMSPNAQYARAEMMLHNMQRNDGTSLTEDAFLALESGRQLPGAGILFEQLLITSHAERQLPIERTWWDGLVAKLKARPPDSSDIASLLRLNACYLDDICERDPLLLGAAFDAALAHEVRLASLYSAHAEFAWQILGDRNLAESELRKAINLAPGDVSAHRNLFVLLVSTNQMDKAGEEVRWLKERNWLGRFDSMIAILEHDLTVKMRGASER